MNDGDVASHGNGSNDDGVGGGEFGDKKVCARGGDVGVVMVVQTAGCRMNWLKLVWYERYWL